MVTNMSMTGMMTDVTGKIDIAERIKCSCSIFTMLLYWYRNAASNFTCHYNNNISLHKIHLLML